MSTVDALSGCSPSLRSPRGEEGVGKCRVCDADFQHFNVVLKGMDENRECMLSVPVGEGLAQVAHVPQLHASEFKISTNLTQARSPLNSDAPAIEGGLHPVSPLPCV